MKKLSTTAAQFCLGFVLLLTLASMAGAQVCQTSIGAGFCCNWKEAVCLYSPIDRTTGNGMMTCRNCMPPNPTTGQYFYVGGTPECTGYPKELVLTFSEPVRDVSMETHGARTAVDNRGYTINLDDGGPIPESGYAYFPGDGITSVTLKDPFYYEDGSWVIAPRNIRYTPATCAYCTTPMIAQPQPVSIQSFDLNTVNLTPWSMDVAVTPQDGLVVSNVKLGRRYFAEKISIPYFTLETNKFAKQRGELKPAGTDASMRSQLINYNTFSDAEKLVIEADYRIDQLPAQSQSCLIITQRYEFYNVKVGDHCEPSGSLPCARWRPIVKYRFLGKNGEILKNINIVQRQHLTIDGQTRNTAAFFRDRDISQLSDLGNILSNGIAFSNKLNPLFEEWHSFVVVNGHDTYQADNYHQTYKPFVEEPYIVRIPLDGNFSIVHPGCPECVHSHWRWGTSTTLFYVPDGGGGLINMGTNQDLDVGVSLNNPGEEHPTDFLSLIQFGSPIRTFPANTTDALMKFISSVPEDIVYWQSAHGYQSTDIFFAYGDYVSPLLDVTQLYGGGGGASSATQATTSTGLAPASSGEDGITSITAQNVYTTAATNVSLFDPTPAPPLPSEYVFYNNLNFDITSEAESSGPYTVTFSLLSVTDPTTFANLRILHLEPDPYASDNIIWVDRTVQPPDPQAPDFAARTINAKANSLGQYVVVLMTQPPSTGSADLSITVSASPDPVIAGSNLSLTLNVINNGPQAATEVVLVHPLAPNARFVSALPGQGTCYEEDGIVRCKLGTLSPGANTVVNVVVKALEGGRVIPATGQTLASRAHVRAKEADANLANNTFTENTTLLPDPNAAPTIDITSPNGGAMFAGPASIHITADAADTDGSISKVEFYEGETLIGAGTPVSPTQFALAWNNVPPKTYLLSAVATDNLGKTKLSQARSIVVNGSASVSITSPVESNSFNAPATININATAISNGGSISKVEFYANGLLIGEGTTTGANQYNLTWNDPATGTYLLAAVATDEQGVATTSSPVKVMINSLPVVRLTSPATGTGFTAPAAMTITANALDVDEGIVKVDFYANGTLIGTGTPGLYQYSFSWSNVPAGNYALTAVATDFQGATAVSNAVNVTVNAPPSITITSPTNNSAFASPANVAVTATISDDGSINKVEFLANGFKIGDGALTGPNQYSVNWANVNLGVYTLSAVATDNLGVKTTASISVKATLPVLFVTGSTTLNSSDAAIKSRLETLGYAVTVKDDVNAMSADAENMSVVIISSTVSPTNVGTKFRTVTVPVVTWDSALYSDMGMTDTLSTNYGSATGQTQLSITNTSHPLAGGLSGTQTVVTVSGTLSWGKPNANAAPVATIVGDATKVVIFGYDKAATMPGLVAPARRVGLYLFDDTAANFSTNGTALFDAAMKWALGTASLSANSSVVPSGSRIDLTAEGDVDWVHWGLSTANSVNRKSVPTQKLSNFIWIGNAAVSRFADNTSSYAWSDGTPTQSVFNTSTGISTSGLANGFQVNVPADTNLRTIKLYVGVWRAQGKLQVSMSDGSVPAYVDSSLNNNGGSTHGVYIISFKAASGNQNLSLKYTVQTDYSVPNGNVALEAITLMNGGPPNMRPVASITSPANGTTYAAPTNLTINANATDSDGTISKVEFFANSIKLGETTTAPYSFNWNNVTAGNYTLTAVATDNNGATSENLSAVDITVAGSGGGLNGSMVVPAVPRQVNLTTEGTLDWAHWGLTTASSFDHKAGVASQISNYTKLGLNSPARFADNPTGFTWTDGTPTANALNSTTGIYVGGLNNGFEITVPADTNPKTLKLYVGLWSARGQLQATLSDASAMPYTDSSLVNLSATSNGVYTIVFKAAADGQTLKVKWKVLSGQGNVTLQAATLVSGGTFNTPPTVSLTSPANGTTYAAPTNLTINANATDSDGTISKVEFFANSTKIGESTTAPYSFTWNNVAAGNYALSAIATDNSGATATSGSVNISVLSSALFVTGSTTLNTSDAAIRTRLQNLGYGVTVKAAASALGTDANGKTVVVISSTVTPTSLGTKFKSVAVPLVMWESLSYFDMGMTAKGTANAGTATGQTQVKITQPAHALAGGLSGTQTVVTASSTFAWGKPNANAVSIASLASDSTKIIIFGYRQGTAMPGLTAPAKRVGLFLNDTTAASFNNNGWALFDAAVNWATSLAP